VAADTTIVAPEFLDVAAVVKDVGFQKEVTMAAAAGRLTSKRQVEMMADVARALASQSGVVGMVIEQNQSTISISVQYENLWTFDRECNLSGSPEFQNVGTLVR
jgi:hypothetical protein